MFSTFKKGAAAVAALALAGVGMAATAAPASAALATTPPAYVGNTAVDPNSNGNFLLYDANGNRIVGGSLTNLGGAIYAVSGQTARTGAIKANLSIAAPDHTKVASLWASQTLSGSTNFPVAGTIPNVSGVAGPVVTLNGTTDGNAASFLSVAVLDTTAGYAGYAQLRVKDTASPAATTWATMEIAIDVAAGTWAQVSPGVTYTSTTTSAPTFSPVSPVASGTAVTLTSSVTPSNATGSVHFFDGSTDLGAATFTGGTATLAHVFTNTTNPKVNETHGITAVYTPTGLFSPSTSSVSNLVVQATPLISTTTALTLSQATVTLGSTDVLTATAVVTPTSAAPATGTVAFYVDGSSSANATGTLTAGSTGAVTINFSGLTGSSSPGTAHTIVATYTDANTYAGSSSAAATVNVIASYASDTQNIQTSITAGTITIATPYYLCSNAASNFTGFAGGVKPSPCTDNPLVLPAMVLNSTATEYATSAAFTGISVADTRPGNLAYTIQAISSNLTKVGVASPNASQTINSQNVGLNISSLTSTNATPNTFLGTQTPGASTAGQNFTGFNNAAAAHVAAGDTGSLGLGGSSPHTVLHANSGLGTTVTAGTLSITAPSNTLDGTYTGTVTFSIIGN